jgi:hypothetical protein
MTAQERASALVEVGLTPRQATFVTLAALVGGHCLRRQYQAFTGLAPGATVREFLDGLVAREWSTRHRFRTDRAHVYHLSGTSTPRSAIPTTATVARSGACRARRLMLLTSSSPTRLGLARPRPTRSDSASDSASRGTAFGVSTGPRPGGTSRRPSALIDKQPLAVSDAGIHRLRDHRPAAQLERWLRDYTARIERHRHHLPTRTIGTHRTCSSGGTRTAPPDDGG